MDRYEFEQRIKEYIKDDGRSQAYVARKLGYTPDTFNKWVRGVNRMPDGVLADFCALLSVPAFVQDELFSLAGYALPRTNHAISTPPHLPTQSFLFATQIYPDGRAIDPGNEFTADITDIYAVFRPDSTIPGTVIGAANPDPEAYYAYLTITGDPIISKFGWRWYCNGEMVNDFSMDVRPRMTVWLQKFGYEEGGIFGSEPSGVGHYRVVILLGGNPAISAPMSIRHPDIR